MKSIYLHLFLCAALFASCAGLKKLPGNMEETVAEVIAEKPTVGNEKIVSAGVVPPFFYNLFEINNYAGVFVSYNAFHSGNAYANLCYLPAGFGFSDKNPNSFQLSPITHQIQYSLPILKFSKNRKGYMEFDRSNQEIQMYYANICYKKSVNLRIGSASNLNLIDGTDLDADNTNIFWETDFLERHNYLSTGLSYGIFLDHQSHLKVENKVYKNTINQFVEFFFDVNYGVGSQIEQVRDEDATQDFPDQTADFNLNNIGYSAGIKYSYVSKHIMMTFHLGYRKLPHYEYNMGYTAISKGYFNSAVFGMEIGYSKQLATEGRVF